MLEKKKKSKSP